MRTSSPEAPTALVPLPKVREEIESSLAGSRQESSRTRAVVEDTGSPSSVRVCSGCGLSETELNHSGLFGCPRCYETFAALVVYAVEELHGVRVPESYGQPRVTQRTITNPWPTRRGVRR